MAFAADGDTGTTEDDIGEIVVTALRTNETLRQTPATVSVFTADTLAQTGIKTASDFVNYTPGVTIVANTAEAGDNQINIRGINSARDAESSVALVVDGILKTNTAVLNQDQGTVSQIEVLKGPQGALYGRNAAAGAIVITTQKPGDVLAGQIRASYGNNSTFSGAASVSGPLGDKVGIVVSGDYYKTDGFFRNRFLDNAAVIDNRESWNINGRLMGDLGEKTRFDLKMRTGQLDGGSINFNPVFGVPIFAQAFSQPAFFQDVNEHPFLYDSNIAAKNHQETYEASLKLEHDFDKFTLTAWGLYSNVKNWLYSDGTSGDFQRYSNTTLNPSCQSTTLGLIAYEVNPPSYIFGFGGLNSLYAAYSPTTCDGTQYQQRDQRDISFEVRLASNDASAPLHWQLGGYYLNLHRTVAVSLGADLGHGVLANIYNGPSSTNPTSQLYWDAYRTNVYAGFGSLEYKASDQLKMSLALRYDREERSVHNLVPTALDPFTGGALNPGQTIVNNVVQPIPDHSKAFDQVEPKVSVTYTPNRDLSLFANWGIGFKSGGFNNQGSSSVVTTYFPFANLKINDQFKKEWSSAFEAGVKGKAGPLNYELSGYYTEVHDMQYFEFLVGGFGLLRVVSNIDRVNISGLEANVSVKPMKGWSIFGSVDVTDSKIKANSSRPDTVGNKSPYTADYTLNAGTSLTVPVTSAIDLTTRLDWRRVGPTWFSTVQNQQVPTIWGVPGDFSKTRRSAYDIVNLRVSVEGKSWKLSAFANNLFDKNFLAEVIPAAEFGGSFVSPGDRRSYGAELSYKF